jgi:Domain of unknown function (DUF4411)
LKSAPAPNLMERYAMDSSFFLDLWKENEGAFPKHIFVGIWEALGAGIAAGHVVAPNSVRDELRNTVDPRLKGWVTDHAYMFIPFDKAQLASVTEIVRKFPGYAKEARNLADPQVVALARVRALAVLTSEKRADFLGKNPKMPNVCETFGVDWHDIRSYCTTEDLQLVQATGSGV